MLSLLFLTILLIKSTCSFKSNIISIEDNSFISDIKHQNRSIFLRLIDPNFYYSQLSQDQWKYAAKIFPQVDFVTINCIRNTAICSLFGDSLTFPYYSFIQGNSSTLINNEDAIFSINGTYDIESTPQHYIDIVYKYSNIYPISPPLFNLIPSTTNSFYKNSFNPIFLLYNSDCSEQVEFINSWSKITNEYLYLSDTNPKVGLLDCAVYPDECQRWFQEKTVLTPSALVYSQKTGNFKLFNNTDSPITYEKLLKLIFESDFLPRKPTPSPLPNSQTLFDFTEKVDDDIFNENDFCLYNLNIEKCGQKIGLSNRFKADSSQFDFLKDLPNEVKIHVAEPIQLNDELVIKTKRKVSFFGSKINGRIRIEAGSAVEIQDPSETDFIIDWRFDTDEIGLLNSNGEISPKSLKVDIFDITEKNATNLKRKLYKGKLNECSLSRSIYQGENKDIFFSIEKDSSQYYLTTFVVNSCDFFYDSDFDKSEVNGIQIKDVTEMSTQQSSKRKIKIFTSKYITNIDLNSFIPGPKRRDYEFITKGSYFQVTCDMKIEHLINFITFSGFNYGVRTQDFTVIYNTTHGNTTTVNSKKCELESKVFLKKSKSSSSHSEFFNANDGDDFSMPRKFISIKDTYYNEYECDIYPAPGYDIQYINAYKTNPNYRQCIVNIGTSYSTYYIILDFNYPFLLKYERVIVRPSSSYRSTPVTIQIVNKDKQNEVIPNYFTTFNVFFENFESLTINNPIYLGTMSFHRYYNFSNCGTVNFINYGSSATDTDIHVELKNPFYLVGGSQFDMTVNYGISTDLAEFSVIENGFYTFPYVVTDHLTSSGGNKHFNSIKVKKSITSENSEITLSDCLLNNDIEINLIMSRNSWPSVQVTSGNLRPSKINFTIDIDPSMVDSNPHIMVKGFQSDSCTNYLSKVKTNLDSTFVIGCIGDYMYVEGGHFPSSSTAEPSTQTLTKTPETYTWSPTTWTQSPTTMSPSRSRSPTKSMSPSRSRSPTQSRSPSRSRSPPPTRSISPSRSTSATRSVSPTATTRTQDPSTRTQTQTVQTQTLSQSYSSQTQSNPSIPIHVPSERTLIPFPSDFGNKSSTTKKIGGVFPPGAVVAFSIIGVCILVLIIVIPIVKTRLKVPVQNNSGT